MKSPSKSQQPSDQPRPGKPESRASRETFPHRTERPGEAGLANEARPGLGTRGDDDGREPLQRTPGKAKVDAEPLGRNAPLTPREPRDQKPGSKAHQEELDTGASGKMGLK